MTTLLAQQAFKETVRGHYEVNKNAVDPDTYKQIRSLVLEGLDAMIAAPNEEERQAAFEAITEKNPTQIGGAAKNIVAMAYYTISNKINDQQINSAPDSPAVEEQHLSS